MAKGLAPESRHESPHFHPHASPQIPSDQDLA